jgi:hypothetical protein
MESRQPLAAQGIDGFFGRHLVDGGTAKEAWQAGALSIAGRVVKN